MLDDGVQGVQAELRVADVATLLAEAVEEGASDAQPSSFPPDALGSSPPDAMTDI
jgi:hypothetical protein